MAIRRIEHFAIAVKDMEKSLRFYRDLLGMKLHSYKVSSIEEHANIFRDASKGKRRHVQLVYGEGPGQGMVVVTEMPGGSKAHPSCSTRWEFRISRSKSTTYLPSRRRPRQPAIKSRRLRSRRPPAAIHVT